MSDRGNNQLKQKLSQNLSTWQIQVMNMVMLPHAELAERIKQELIENPALEEGVSEEDHHENEDIESGDGLSAEELSMGDYADIDDVPETTLQRYYEGQRSPTDIPYAEEQSLQEVLNSQLPLTPLNSEEQLIASFLVGSLDEDGYLRRSLQGISDDLAIYQGVDVPEEQLEYILEVVQGLEPAGVGARSLDECLLLQLERRKSSKEIQLAKTLVKDYFEELSKKQLQKLAEKVGVEEEELIKAIQIITNLNPTPGLDFTSRLQDSLMTVVPDFEVTEQDGELIVTLYSGDIPEVRVSRAFEEQLKEYTEGDEAKTGEDREVRRFVKQKLSDARGFVEMIKQRNNTMITTMMAIVELQRDYFLTGDIALLRPMILQDVADKVGYDVSTISRVTSTKYVQTDFGVLPIKLLFSEGITRDDGEEVTTRSVKALLKKLIEEEDKQDPLSDETLKYRLKSHGFDVARRTIAKYRDSMGIPIARLRKDW
ncbi:MAG: RNA polymerase factor sigma-54 [Bacteroidales bacterium]|uniref:RNA polymerase factor sigma-54 n=1 Tax=Porphyromonas sp. TaxID=1924944 RepID=UPI0029766D0A|nr:RNA polymerase factor sigma-54 [Porphyromonas sp.]MDD7438021.1 RNA polymerase factor sigma-54 [Bacteroidales bacterium]MDY3066877.1 RNA polymerase factor sigma-54 [Porphyromonas sp.]